MAQSLLSALARTGQGSLQTVWRWYAAQWRRQGSLRGKGLLVALALCVLLCPCVAANALLRGGSPAPGATTAALMAAPSRMPTVTPPATPRPTLTPAPEATDTPRRTLKPSATPQPSIVLTLEPTAAPTLVPATSTPPGGECAYIGNRRKDSMVFHYPSCSYVDGIGDRNRVCLHSREEAAQRGFRPCKVCKP